MADQDKNAALSQLYLLMQAAQSQGNNNAPVAALHGGNFMDNIAAIQKLLVMQQQTQQQPQPSAAWCGGNILAALRQHGISPNMLPLPQHISSMNAQSIMQCLPTSQNGINGGMNIVQLTLLEALRRQQHPVGQQAFSSALAGLTRPLSTIQQAATDQAKASYQGSVQPLNAVSSANLNNESAKEENKRKTIPCRARGMPQDHNFKTANFMITNDVKHGQGLVCSYPKCRDGGIKFLYCKYCAIPVSKRMFRTRHNNCGKESAEEEQISYTAGGKAPTEAAAAKEVEAKKYAKASPQGSSGSCDSVKDSKPSEISLSSSDGGDSSSFEPTDGKPHASSAQAPSRKLESKAPAQQQPQSKPIIPPVLLAASAINETKQAQQREWATLLDTRPSHTEGDKMSAWIMAVLSVSESCAPEKKDSKKPAEARSGDKAEESDRKDCQRKCEEREHMPLKKRRMAEYQEEEQAQSRDSKKARIHHD